VFASLSSRLRDDRRTGDAWERASVHSRRSASGVIAGCVAVATAGGVSYALTVAPVGIVETKLSAFTVTNAGTHLIDVVVPPATGPFWLN